MRMKKAEFLLWLEALGKELKRINVHAGQATCNAIQAVVASGKFDDEGDAENEN
jgi:hypothetical protein